MSPGDVGKFVVAPSGRIIGEVTKIRPPCFEVLLRDGELTWLSEDCVFTIDAREVELVCEPEGVKRYTVTPRESADQLA